MVTFLKKIQQWWRGVAVLLVLLIVGLVVWLWPVAQPPKASLVLQPSNQSVRASQTFEARVEVQSSQPANAVDATVHYPVERLEVVRTSSKQSRFDMILFPAAVDKKAGTVRFLQATVVPFKGSASQGLVGTVTFKARQDGPADVSISGKIVANNSQGTDLTGPVPAKRLWQIWLGR